MDIAELFAAADLTAQGPVAWGRPCQERRPGIYVVVIDRAIVYVGRSQRSLTRRIGEFYRHKYGDPSPHRGGQQLLLLDGARFVYWCATDDPRNAERQMLEAFRLRFGRLPFANLKRGDN